MLFKLRHYWYKFCVKFFNWRRIFFDKKKPRIVFKFYVVLVQTHFNNTKWWLNKCICEIPYAFKSSRKFLFLNILEENDLKHKDTQLRSSHFNKRKTECCMRFTHLTGTIKSMTETTRKSWRRHYHCPPSPSTWQILHIRFWASKQINNVSRLFCLFRFFFIQIIWEIFSPKIYYVDKVTSADFSRLVFFFIFYSKILELPECFRAGDAIYPK